MVDLTGKINRKQWEEAVRSNQIAIDNGYLSDAEENFVRDMLEEWSMNGTMMEPSLKQFEWFKQIAFENAKFESIRRLR